MISVVERPLTDGDPFADGVWVPMCDECFRGRQASALFTPSMDPRPVRGVGFSMTKRCQAHPRRHAVAELQTHPPARAKEKT